MDKIIKRFLSQKVVDTQVRGRAVTHRIACHVEYTDGTFAHIIHLVTDWEMEDGTVVMGFPQTIQTTP